MRQCIPSAADLLLKNYICLAQDFTDAATPQDDFLATITSDLRYERALQGIRLLAQHHVGQLVQSLISWRQSVNEDIKKNYSTNNVVNLQGVCKRAAMEVLFLEAAMQVLDEFVPEFWQDSQFQGFFKSMLHVAFRWVLNAEEYVPHQELAAVRSSVVHVSSCIIGIMSQIRLADVTAAFVQKLDERVHQRKDPAPRADMNLLRAQALKLCAGMHGVRLSFESDAQLEQSTHFLKQVHPLHYTAAVKKSQIHHALCEMLTDILAPLIRSNEPQGCPGLGAELLTDWYQTVLRVKNEVGQWVNKHSKHTTVGYPLVTVLVCLVRGDDYTKQVESMSDFLVKQMKVKEHRLLCFKCLNYLVTSCLVRNRASASSAPTSAWLDKVVKPVLTSARKVGIQAKEQQEFLANIADLCPEYCIRSIVLELLQSDSAEAQLVALHTLHVIATSVPVGQSTSLGLQACAMRYSTTLALRGSSSTSNSLAGSATCSRHMVQIPADAVLDLIRGNQHPFELQGITHLLPRVQQQLALLLAQCHRSVGSSLLYGAEPLPKDKHTQLELFRLVLMLIPFLCPEQWAAPRPLDYLALYTAHTDSAVRSCAHAALLGIVRGCPVLRSPVLASLAAFLAIIPDEAVQVAREALALLRTLMDLWMSLLQEQRLMSTLIPCRIDSDSHGRHRQPQAQRLSAASSSHDTTGLKLGVQIPLEPACFALDLHRLEGVFVMLLCSPDQEIRLDAFCALGLVRSLHQQLYTMKAELGLHNASPSQVQQQCQQASPAGAASNVGGSFSSISTVAAAGVAASSDAVSTPAATPPAGALASSGLFFRHKATASRDSFEFTNTPAPLITPDDEGLCVMDVLEEMGDDVVHRCYWDFGDWSDLWRETKHVPGGANLLAVVGAADEVGTLRWMRCLVDIVRSACHMCPTSMGVAYQEMLQKLSRYLGRDSAGRLAIPADAVDGRRSEAWRALVLAVCVSPLSLRDRSERAAARKGPGFTGRDVVRALLSSPPVGSAVLQQVCLMALGHCSHEHYPVLCEDLPSLIEEYSRTKQRRGTVTRPEEARKSVANVLRILADAMPPGTLTTQPALRARYLEWIRDTAGFLKQLPRFGEAFWEVSQVAYCLCAVCRRVAHELVGPMTLPLSMMREAPSAQRANSNRSSLSEPMTPGNSTVSQAQGLPHKAPAGPVAASADSIAVAGVGPNMAGQSVAVRKLLFEMFAAWCEEGSEDYRDSLSAGMSTALMRLRDCDVDVREGFSQELAQAAEFLDQAAQLAMVAMLKGPVFDSDARRAQGPVLRWIDRLLMAPPLGISSGIVPAIPKGAVARTALLNLLRSNPEMFSVCVDRCYDRDPRIATTSFQVLNEVYALQQVKVEPHVVLSLVLYKMVDPNADVREDSLHMLQVLSMREWQTSSSSPTLGQAGQGYGHPSEQLSLDAGGSRSVLVLGTLQDSYQQYQYELAVSLARDHPELSEALCEEMMTRQLELADKVSQHPVLMCLTPWMENLTISSHWKGTWCERLLKSMYYVTLRHGDKLPLEIERLWRTLAHNRRNIIPVLDFLASHGTHVAYQQELSAMLEYLGVSKRICLYLARKNAQQTIDHLVYEVSLQLLEDEVSTTGSSSGGTTLGSGSSQLAGMPLEFAAVLQQPSGAANTTIQHPLPASAVQQSLGASSAFRPPFGSWWAQGASSGAAPAIAGQLASGPWSSYVQPVPAGSGHMAKAASVPADQSTQQLTGVTSSLASVAALQDSSASNSTAALHRDSVEVEGIERRDSSVATGAPQLPSGGSSSQGGTALLRSSTTDQSDASSVSSMSVSAAGTANVDAAGSSSNLAEPPAAATAAPAAANASSAWENTPSALSSTQVGAAPATNSSLGGQGPLAGFRSVVVGPPDAAGLNLSDFYASRPAGSMLAGGSRGRGAVTAPRDEGAWLAGAETARNSPRPTREPLSPVLRGMVTRPELALCLLTEVVYEHDEDVSSHLALLCHVCLLLADHDEPLVASAAQQLLVNCLYSLSCHFQEVMQEELKTADSSQASALIKYVQSMREHRLWPLEDLSLDQQEELGSTRALTNMVQHCLAAFNFEPGLQQAWVHVALDWAIHTRSRHLTCRSQQVLRGLRPQLTGEMCGTLLLCLQQCLAAAEGSAGARDVALELLLTLRELVQGLSAHKLLLYPQVFWASLSLLFSSYVSIYKQALLLLTACLQQLSLHDATTQNILLAAAPAADHKKLQQLLAQCQALSSSSTATGSFHGPRGMRVPSPNLGPSDNASAGSTKLHYATAPVGRSSTSSSAVDADPAGGMPALSTPQDVASSWVGGVAAEGGRPMQWPFAQLLPWPDRGPEGPAEHMLAVQQVLFKGLLFSQSQVQAVRLYTALARGLCHLPPGAARPSQAPSTPTAKDAISQGTYHKDQGAQPSIPSLTNVSASCHVAASHTLDGSGANRSSSVSRPTTGSSSGPWAADDSGDGPGEVCRSEAGLRTSAGGGQGQLSARARAARFWQSMQQDRHQHTPGSTAQQQLGALDWEDAAALSRSAPELRAASAAGIDASQWQHGCTAAPQASCSMWTSLRLQGKGSSPQTSRRHPATRAAFQCILGHRHAQLVASIACIVPFFCSQLGMVEPDSELLMNLRECLYALHSACCCHGFEQLGSPLQLLADSVTVNATSSSSSSSPEHRSAGSSLAAMGCVQPTNPLEHIRAHRTLQRQKQQSQKLQQASLPSNRVAAGVMNTTDSTDVLCGYTHQQQALAAQPSLVNPVLLKLMQSVCLHLSRTLLPTFGEWLLRFWVGLLLLPGAEAMHSHVLVLLKCLFTTPRLQLGAAAALLRDAAFLSPVVTLTQLTGVPPVKPELTYSCNPVIDQAGVAWPICLDVGVNAQGPLCACALEALEAIMTYADHFPEQQQGSLTALAAGHSVDLHGLAAGLLPQLDVVTLLQRVLECMTASPRKRRQRVMPFLAECGSNSAGTTQTVRLPGD